MSYGLKYRANFDSIKGPLESFQVDISQKDYTHSWEYINLSGTPVIQEWQDDDPKQAIRGCTLKVSILTEEGGLQLTDFYSENDNEFLVQFYCSNTGQKLFEGYLLQDDCAEIQVDFLHEISLTFTDMLGTLKDVTFDVAAKNIGTLTTINGIDFYNPSPLANNTICSFDAQVGVLKPGDKFKLYSSITTPNTFEFTCFDISYQMLLGWVINIGEPCPFSGTITFDFSYTIPYPLDTYMPLKDVLKLCLKSTQLDLQLFSFVTIYPTSGTIESTWDDTYVDPATFYDGNEWMDCYSILENLMNRFNASLFQADGYWKIVRWDEMYRYTNHQGATMLGHYYDTDFNYLATTTSNKNFVFYGGTDMETGVIKSVQRPYQYVKETFNYKIPELICNKNFNDLGNLRNEYDSGTLHIKEYGLNKWYNGPYSPIPDRFIRILTDIDPLSQNYKQETERFAVIYDNSGDNSRAVKSCDIPLSKNDYFRYSFSFRTNISQPGNVNTIFAITLTDGVNTKFLHNDGSWQNTVGYSYNVPAGDNTDQWHSVDMTSSLAPFDGVLNIYLAVATFNQPSTDETHYKDLNLQIFYRINNTVNINGHTHTDFQNITTKNNNEEDIYLDNTPSNSISGTLFLDSYNGLLRNRTVEWEYPGFTQKFLNLGIATTQESLFTRFKPRTKYEGNLLYLRRIQGEQYIWVNPISVFLAKNAMNIYRFVPGKVSIDYKNSVVDITLYELLDNMGGDFDGTTITPPVGPPFTIPGLINEFIGWTENTSIYEFNYLYETNQ
jgi:hypothetical protein